MLELQHIDVRLNDVSILRDVNFDVKQGETFGIVGPNGAGKTTILNVVSGIVRPVAGDVVFNGKSIKGAAPHRVPDLGIGRSLQSTHYFADLTVLNLITLGFLPNSVWGALRFNDHRRTRAHKDEARNRALDVIKLLGLTAYADRPLGELSSAMQKLADMGRAVAVGSRLILLDEPTSGVSLKERGAIAEALQTLRGLGRTIVLIDHDPGFVVANCDRLMAMNFGEVLRVGEPREVMGSAEVRKSYLGEATAPA
jgi:branched-chain amino acid transport system ATP-binding protein